MLKRVVLFLVVFCLSVSSVWADGNLEESEAKNTVYTLTLDDAISLATEDNPKLNACDIKKENYKTQLSAAYIQKSAYKNNSVKIYASSGYDAIYIKNGYYVDLYESQVGLCDYEYEQIKSTLAYNVTQKYYNLKNCEKLLNIAKNSYNLVSENYNNAKTSYNLGLIPKYDLDSTAIGLKKAENAVLLYENNMNIAKEDFKIAIRKNNEDCDFVLTDEIKCEDFDTNLSDDLINAEKSRYDIAGLKSQYDLSKKYLDMTALPSNTARYTDAYSKFITAEYNYTNNKDLILLGIKTSYNSISSAKNDMDTARDNLTLVNDAYNIAKIKYEQGMITSTELTSALNNISQAEIELENAKLTYELAVKKYQYEISIGL